jgi:hypothetical protein
MKEDKNKVELNSKKREKEQKLQMKKIKMSIKSSISVTIKANLTEALKIIDIHPNSIAVEKNYIRFLFDEYDLIEFQRLFFNSWKLMLNSKYKSISYKYLTTNTAKVIIINIYHGYSLLDLLNYNKKQETYNKKLSEIIQKIQMYIKLNKICQYCNNKITKIEQECCDYCGIVLNLKRFFYQNIFIELFS